MSHAHRAVALARPQCIVLHDLNTSLPKTSYIALSHATSKKAYEIQLAYVIWVVWQSSARALILEHHMSMQAPKYGGVQEQQCFNTLRRTPVPLWTLQERGPYIVSAQSAASLRRWYRAHKLVQLKAEGG